MIEKILRDFVSWPAVKREIEANKLHFEEEFGVVLLINDAELKKLFKKWRQNILNYLDSFEPEEIDGRRIVTIAVEDACYDFVVSQAVQYQGISKTFAINKPNFRSDGEIFYKLVQDYASICFALFFAARRVERLVREARPDLEIKPRFRQDNLFRIEEAVNAIEDDRDEAGRVLDWLDLRSLIEVFNKR